MSELIYGCTTKTLTKYFEKKLDEQIIEAASYKIETVTNILGTVWEVTANSKAMFSYRLLHKDTPEKIYGGSPNELWHCRKCIQTPVAQLHSQMKEHFNQPIGIMIRVFTNGPENQGSIPVQIIPKTQKKKKEKKKRLDASLLNTQHHKVCIKGKWNNQRQRAPPHAHTWAL